MEKKSPSAPGTDWKGTWPDWPYVAPFVPPAGTTPREVKTHDDLGYRVVDAKREPGEDG